MTQLRTIHITACAENAVLLNIPRTGGKSSELPFEVFCRKICNFLSNIFFVLPFGGYCCKLCPSDNPRRTKSQGLRSGDRAGQIPLLIIVPEDIGQSLNRHTCGVGSSWVLLKLVVVFLLLLTLKTSARE
jgi:hypothetical protein